MEEQLNLLIQLQEIDGRVRAHTDRKKLLPEALAALERRRTESKEGLDQVKETLHEAQKNKRDRDKDLESAVQKIEKLKARASEIKTNKEYQAQLKEIEAAEQENRAMEDEILVLMEKIDAAAAGITAAEQRMKEEETAIRDEQKQIEDSFAKLEEELSAANQARLEIASKVQPPLLDRYQRLIGTKAGIAIAEARGESCSGCYMSIPPQVFVNVKKNESIITCPQCGRILYYKEAIELKSP